MLVGYARVSTLDQSLQIQLEKLAHVDKLFQEKHTATTDKRPVLQECLSFVREGDVLIITRLDRLARSTLHLCQIAELLRRKGVDLQVLDQHIETATATGRLLFNMLGAIAQFETELRHERQMAGIRAAQAQGKHCGRGKSLTSEQARALQRDYADQVPLEALKHRYGIGKTAIYRYLKDDGTPTALGQAVLHGTARPASQASSSLPEGEAEAVAD